MAVQDAAVGARVRQDVAAEKTEFGINRRQRRDGVAFAEHEQILAAPRRVVYIGIEEAAVVHATPAESPPRKRRRRAGP